MNRAHGRPATADQGALPLATWSRQYPRVSERWFGVRCVLRFGEPDGASGGLFEERITLWRATSEAAAVASAEDEAARYAEGLAPCQYLGLAQAFELAEPPGEGGEVFSMMRDSNLAPSAYLDRFFDTGDERQRSSGGPA